MKVYVVTEVYEQDGKDICVVAGVFPSKEKAQKNIESIKEEEREDALVGLDDDEIKALTGA